MRTLARLTRLLTLLLILVFACQPEGDEILQDDPDRLEIEELISGAEEVSLNISARIAQDIDQCTEPLEIPLLAYRYKNVGDVIINNSEDFLTATFKTSEDFSLDRTFLVLIIENKDPINNTRFFSNYRKIIIPVEHSIGTMEYTYNIPFADFNLEGGDCLSIIAFSFLNTGSNSNYYRKTFALAKQQNNNSKGIFRRYFIEYCLQECKQVKPVDDESCPVICSYGFGIPSVDVSNSYSFEDLGITDWAWGYAHEINPETLFRLPIKQDDSESAAIIGQVTVMIDNEFAYVYFQMNDGYPMSKTSLYFSHALPESGVPCNYTYNREYTNSDGTWKPTLTDTYVIENVSEILAKSGETIDDPNNTDKKLYIIAYADFCE